MASNISASTRTNALPETLRSRLVRARDAYGKPRVLRATGVSETTFWRAQAGGTVYHGTAVAIAQGLDELEKQAP